ncbi:ATP-binding protein [Bradyrhizobium sp. 25ACV]
MEVGGWLRKLGLERYEAVFREHEIDGAVLPSLTAEDLKDLGVHSVGHRRKLLDAIAVLRGDGRGSAQFPESMADSNEAAPDTAERRHVTVMFSDLVGSTALSVRMDPEDLRDIISAYQTCVAETVRRFGGYVAKFLGDGVLAYFGYPVAHEDDAERAVRAGLAMIDAVATLAAPEPLQVRVGAATGLVVVGDLVGSGQAQECGIVGETPNLAARLQGGAEPNTVVIAEATRSLLGNLFELREFEPKGLKGIAGRVKAFAVLRASSVESRFEAMHPGGPTPLVGREEELELLQRRWAKAKAGEGQVVLLSGEPGLGKSRLTAALMEILASEPHTRLRNFCSPQHTDRAFYPIIGHFERVAGFTRGDTLQTKLDKLDAILAQTSTSKLDAALLAELLSLPNDGRYPALDPAPEQRRQKTLEALGGQIEALARSSPVLMIFEDAHWSDPTSLEVLGRVIDRITALRVLMIVTFRPEFAAPWVGQPHVTALALNRLAGRDVNSLIDRVLGNNRLPTNIRNDIVERTDGIPLFVEEMTKAVLEAGSEVQARQMVAAIPVPALAVPASLQASLMARLDRLGPAKELAQVGAAIGREFSHALLAAVVHQPEANLSSSLDRLIQAGLLFRRGIPPHATYFFKHALVQDAAYGTLLREPKRALHARIAEALQSQLADVADAQPDLLARHYTEAGLIDTAAALWGKAGLRSIQHSALVEALEQLMRALAQIATLPATPRLRREEIKLRVALLYPLQHVKGQGAPEVKAAAERTILLIEQAEALGEAPEDPLLLFMALSTLSGTYLTAFNGDRACESAARLLALAEKQKDTLPIVFAHCRFGVALVEMGNFAQGLAHLRTIALYDPLEHRETARRRSQDIRQAALLYRSRAQWALGYREAAILDAERALNHARDTGHASTLMLALAPVCLTKLLNGDYVAAKNLSDELIQLAEEKGSIFWKSAGVLRRAAVLVSTGNASDALGIFTASILALRSTGTTIYLPVWLSHLARAYAEVGQFDDAWSTVAEAMTLVEATKEQWYEAELHRIAGEISLMPSEPDAAKAQSHFEQALAIARGQQAKSWELRAATSLARLWRDQGKLEDAKQLLAPVFGWFTEGFDTLDLKRANALLTELGCADPCRS